MQTWVLLSYLLATFGLVAEALPFSIPRFWASEKRQTTPAPSGESTSGTPRTHLGNVPYGTIINKCTVSDTVALTFDDGPSQYTSSILDLLGKYNAKATFFVNGNNNPIAPIDVASTPWPDLLRRMHGDGHQIASHTWRHQDLTTASPADRETQMVYNEMALRNIFGFFPTYMRPPYATCTAESGCQDDLAKRGYHVVNFDIDTKDYSHDDPTAIQYSKDVFKTAITNSGYNQPNSNAGHIVLSHDSHKETAASLTEYMLTTLQELGYHTATVGECLGDPPENWYRSASEGASQPASSDSTQGQPTV